MDKVRIGVVGLGGVAAGWGHLPRLSKFEDVEIRGLCDLREDAVKEAVEKFGGRGYTDFREMLDAEQLDALWVCVPPFAHGDIELEAARRGVHMFIEKPVALTAEQAEEIAEEIDKAGVICSVGYMMRYSDLTDRLKQELSQRRPAVMIAQYFCPLIPKRWWQQKNTSGGQTVEQITHIYDLARYLLGEPELVRAWAVRDVIDCPEWCDIEHAMVSQVKFRSGALLSVSNGVTVEQGWYIRVEVAAEGRMYSFEYPQKLVISDGEREEIASQADAFEREERAFIDAVKTGDTSGIRSPYRDAIETLRLTLAVNEAAETGLEVRL